MTRLRHPVFPVSWLIITTIAFLLPGSAIPKVNWLDKIWFDKWVHAGIFIVMVVAWTYMLSYKLKKPVAQISLLVSVFCLVYGIIIELLQHYFILNRSFDPGDIAADAAGCLIGLFFSGRYIKNRPLWKQGSQPKLTAYEKIDCFYNKICISLTQIYCR